MKLIYSDICVYQSMLQMKKMCYILYIYNKCKIYVYIKIYIYIYIYIYLFRCIYSVYIVCIYIYILYLQEIFCKQVYNLLLISEELYQQHCC